MQRKFGSGHELGNAKISEAAASQRSSRAGYMRVVVVGQPGSVWRMGGVVLPSAQS
jgi:hypothetical protein